MDYEQKYKEALERAKNLHKDAIDMGENIRAKQCEIIFPELRKSEDEEIRKRLISLFKSNNTEYFGEFTNHQFVAWLEKQVPIDEDEIVKGIRRGIAISLMNHIDANSKGMNLSNMECEDIENAVVNEDWDKVHGYMKKKLEKQGDAALTDNQMEFLKSLKQRHTWKPSKEQMIALRQVISGCSYDIEPLLELETKLKEF